MYATIFQPLVENKLKCDVAHIVHLFLFIVSISSIFTIYTFQQNRIVDMAKCIIICTDRLKVTICAATAAITLQRLDIPLHNNLKLELLVFLASLISLLLLFAFLKK